nr:hypothetical protein [Tanacetum cinerariifolium]
QYLDEMKRLINSEYHDEIKIDELKGNFNSMSIEINKKEKLQQLEQVANLSTYPLKRFNSFCYDDDADEDYTIVITHDFLITDSLIIENEHLNAIPEMESDEFIKSSVENLVPIPSESEDFSDIESECVMPDYDDSQTINFSTFSNPLFDDSTSSDDDSSHEEVVHEMSFKTYLNPLFDLDEEIISSEFNLIHNEDLDSTPKNDRFDTKSYILESLVNRDTLMASSPKFDSLLEEFSGELAHTDLIPPGINEAFYDDHVKEISSDSTTTHSDSSLYYLFIFDLSINPFPPADRSDFYKFVDELTHIISPPKYDCVCFKIEPNSGDFTMDVMKDTFLTKEPRVHNALSTHPTFQLNLDFILSSESLFTYVCPVCLDFQLMNKKENVEDEFQIMSVHFRSHPSHMVGEASTFLLTPQGVKNLVHLFRSLGIPQNKEALSAKGAALYTRLGTGLLSVNASLVRYEAKPIHTIGEGKTPIS